MDIRRWSLACVAKKCPVQYPPFESGGTVMLHATYGHLAYIWSVITDWLGAFLPAFSNLVLVILGIVLSFQKFTERIEGSSRLRRSLVITCFVLGGISFWSDVRERHASRVSSQILLTNVGTTMQGVQSELKKTDALMDDTARLIGSASVTLPKLNDIQMDITTLKTQINQAREKHDPRLIAQLEGKLKQAESQKTIVASQLLAASGLQMSETLRTRAIDWEGRYSLTRDRIMEQQKRLAMTNKPDHAEEQRLAIEMQTQLDKLDKDELSAISDELESESYLRGQILQLLKDRGLWAAGDEKKAGCSVSSAEELEGCAVQLGELAAKLEK
jgi:hypothetical protein